MFGERLGLRLFVCLGKTVPMPASSTLVRAISSIEIRCGAKERDTFQITFHVGKDPSMDYDLLDGRLDVMQRVIIGVLIGALPEVIIDGVITHQELNPSDEPGQSILTVTGEDLSLLMDLEERSKSYENQPDFVIVTQIAASYGDKGILPPIPTPTPVVPIVLLRIPWQVETDYKFLKRLARRNGYVFYVEPLTVGICMAYFGPEKPPIVPQSALTTNMGPANNVLQIRFFQDALAGVKTKGAFVEPITKTSVPLPELPPLGVPMSMRPVEPQRIVLQRSAARLDPAQAAIAGLGEQAAAQDPVRAEGELDTARYGHVLRARKPVGVRGVGRSYDGVYHVRTVTHKIEPGKYTQRFTLGRDGTGSLLPAVLP